MSVRLTVKQSSEAGGQPTEHVLEDAVITLGRDASCQVVLAQKAVSRSHARITQEGNLYFLEDLGSSYGTQVNGKALPKGEKRLLRNGDVVSIAQFDVRFEKVVELPRDVDSQKTSMVARSMVKDAMRGLSGGEERYLSVMNGTRAGERLEISDAREFVIGRDESADIVFRDDLISRRHVKIRRDWSGTHVEDLGSRNGIKINRKRATRKMLRDGDELEVGGVRFVYVCKSEAAEEHPDPMDEDVPSGSVGDSTSEAPLHVPRKRPAPVEAPPEEPKPEEPKPEEPKPEEPKPEEPKAEEPKPEEPKPEEPKAEEPKAEEPAATPPAEQGMKRYIPVMVMGVFAAVALVVLIVLMIA